jgi:hypothetical protein
VSSHVDIAAPPSFDFAEFRGFVAAVRRAHLDLQRQLARGRDAHGAIFDLAGALCREGLAHLAIVPDRDRRQVGHYHGSCLEHWRHYEVMRRRAGALFPPPGDPAVLVYWKSLARPPSAPARPTRHRDRKEGGDEISHE